MGIYKMNLTLKDRALGAYLGFACGDALGATVEFMTPEQIRAEYGLHRDITGGGWLKLRPGQITDDTEMSIALAQAMIDCGGWDLTRVADSFAAWLRSQPVDIGNTCRRGIRRYIKTGALAGPVNEAEAGNGACMRNLPVAIATLGNAPAFERQTLEQCHLTHHHPLSDAAVLCLGRMLQALVAGEGIEPCRQQAAALIKAHPEFQFDPYPGRAGGYIVETVQTVLYHFFHTDSFEACLTETVNRGEDADTTGALAGMLAGAHYGIDAIPRRWLDRLEPAVSRTIERQTEALLKLSHSGI
jgi:ADP-ribosyl-[dinitrogen reductase] hydrolase